MLTAVRAASQIRREILSTARSSAEPVGSSEIEPLDERDQLVERRTVAAGPVGKFFYGLFPAVAIPAYMILWQGNIGTMLAFWMQFTAEGYYVYLLTGSNTMLAIVGLARSLPMIFVAPVLGTLADRVDRLKMLVAAQAAGAVVAAVVAGLIFSGLIQPWHLVVGALMGGIAIAANFPARQALVMSIVGRKYMLNAVALHTTSIGATRILGPPVAGAMLAVVSVAWCYASTAVLTAAAGAYIRRINPPRVAMPNRNIPFTRDILAGYVYVLKNRKLRPVVAVGVLLSILFYSHYQFVPAIARDVLLSPEAGLAALSAASGAGGLVGALAASRMDSVRRKGILLFTGSMIFGASIFAFAQTDDLPLAAALLLLAGLGSGLAQATNGALLQLLAEDHYRGRMGAVQLVMWGLTPLGGIPMGALGDATSSSFAVGTAAAIGLVLLLLLFAIAPQLRRLRV